MTTDPLMAPPEVAVLLNVKVRTLEHWRLKERGPEYITVEGFVRYRRSAVEAYLKSKTVTP